MKIKNALLVFAAVGFMVPTLNAGGQMCDKSEMMCTDKVKTKVWSFTNCTDQLLEIDLKFPQDGKAMVLLPTKDLQNPNFFTALFKYASMEDPVLVIKHHGKCVPFTVFKGNYATATKNQGRAQVLPGKYKLISNPYKVGFHLLLLDESVNIEDIKAKL